MRTERHDAPNRRFFAILQKRPKTSQDLMTRCCLINVPNVEVSVP
jgi:hypothetical protein